MAEELHNTARENIVYLMEQIGEPLTHIQQIALAGALAVWINKAQSDHCKSCSLIDGG